MKNYDINKGKNQHWKVNNLHGQAMLPNFPVNNFKWFKDTSHFNEDFIKRL